MISETKLIPVPLPLGGYNIRAHGIRRISNDCTGGQERTHTSEAPLLQDLCCVFIAKFCWLEKEYGELCL